MSDCCNPSGYRQLFDAKEAQRRLRHYEKRGLDDMAQVLVDYLSSRNMDGRTVLEAGGGIGAIQVELLSAGASSAINVEMSPEYEETATSLLERNAMTGKVQRLIGDFTEVAGRLEADDVVMNRVICCYPFMDKLMGAAMSSARRFVAVTFPRDRLGAKVSLFVGNSIQKIRGIDFQSYIHPPGLIVAAGESAGFEVVFSERSFVWNAVVFERKKVARK